MQKELRIEPYTAADLHVTAQIWLDGFVSSGVPQPVKSTLEDLEARIEAELENGWALYLARRDDATLGMLALIPATQCLDQLFIAPAAQNRGIGSRLLDFAKTKLPEGIWLKTHADNLNARRFYERHGFRKREEKLDPRYGYPSVIYHWP